MSGVHKVRDYHSKAVLLTVAYFIILILVIYLGLALGWIKVPVGENKLTINEIGDFLSGIFAPVAFIWLAAGFFQQGAELRISSDALTLQVDELAKTTQQHMELVSTTQRALKLETDRAENDFKIYREHQRPNFKITLEVVGDYDYSLGQKKWKDNSACRLRIENIGGEATNVNINVERNSDWMFSDHFASISRNESVVSDNYDIDSFYKGCTCKATADDVFGEGYSKTEHLSLDTSTLKK